jgi:murein L,D-transpeptidase YafK
MVYQAIAISLFTAFFSFSTLAAEKPSEKDSDKVSGKLSEKLEEEKPSIPAGLIHLSEDSVFSKHYFVVDKKQRTLSLYESSAGSPKLVSQYPTDIGKKQGDKAKENDFRTPVGIYFLMKELYSPEIPFDLYGSLAFTTDYPNIFDQRNAKTGSGIWLHAVPDSIPLTRGSRGCVVVRDNVIKELKKFVKLSETPLLIYEEVDYLFPDEYKNIKSKMLQSIESWRSAWENQSIDEYMKFYDASFKNSQMDFNQWYAHKKKLKSIYSSIKVKISDPVILRNQDQVVIRFTQNYQSNFHTDFGEKTIHARWDNNSFKIIREDWINLQSPLIPQASSNGSGN